MTRKLRGAGLEEKQAEAVTETMIEAQRTLATQEDVRATQESVDRLREDVDRLRDDTAARFRALQKSIDRLRDDTEAGFRAMKEYVDKAVSRMSEDIRKDLRLEMEKRFSSLQWHIWGGVGTLVAVLSFLLKT